MNQNQTATSDSISPERLQAVVDSHLLWLQSEGRDGRRANFAGENLSAMDLRGLYLSEANFRGAALNGADFSGANLQCADFSEAELSQTNFRGALLDGANFSRSIARRAYFDEASAIGVNLLGMIFEDASATGVDFSGAKMRDAVLNRTNFSASLLVHAEMRYATAAECNFDGVNLSAADCRDASFDRARFKNALLHEAQMRGASFDQVMFTEADFSRVLELEPQYQTASFVLEKKAIEKELEGLAKLRDEVSHYESHIAQQRHDIAQQRKVLASINELEQEVSSTLLNHMLTARRIAMFWFVAVAVFGIVMLSEAMKEQEALLQTIESRALVVLALLVLCAHVFSAFSAFNMAKQFAGYIRLRREKLSRVGDDAPLTSAKPRNREVTYL